MASITFDHVYKRFGEATILQDLTMKIADEEFLVLVGPSGSGKSTALRCLAGLEEISDGDIWIGDRVVNELPPKERDIAMVFQSYALYPHMSVAENMGFALKLRKMPADEIRQRVQQAADMLDIGHLLDRKPKDLSGGQRQRVALGRAIVRNPAVFLMDEPLSNLDAKLRVQTRAEISKLHQRLKTTFIYVTHDQTEAMTMGNRIAVLRDGILQQLDTPQNLYDHPVNMFVAGFIGSPAMNFFDARITRGDGALMVESPGVFALPIPPRKANALDQYIGKSVRMGIRPEDIYDPHYTPSGVSTDARADVDVAVTEPLGSEVYVYAARNGTEMVGRFDPRTAVRPGDAIEIAFNMDKLHLFDGENERALLVN